METLEINQELNQIDTQEATVVAMSGGVDSSVAAAMMSKDNTCVFVDHGLLRLNEADVVMKTFKENLGVKVIHVNAEGKFLTDLEGIDDPEQKRKIIGKDFVEVFQEEAKKIPNAKWLAQGTIYPDVIESAGGKTDQAPPLKVIIMLEDFQTLCISLLLLRELFKDEVRRVGKSLGLSKDIISRHPFPGPGLGVRILGEVQQKITILQNADAIFIEELKKSGWYDKTSQAFTVFLPVKSVGVMGDGRTYEYVVSLRAVTTTDFMTANWAELPYDLLGRVSNRIINEVKGINRVTYDISSKPPATIEWE